MRKLTLTCKMMVHLRNLTTRMRKQMMERVITFVELRKITTPPLVPTARMSLPPLSQAMVRSRRIGLRTARRRRSSLRLHPAHQNLPSLKQRQITVAAVRRRPRRTAPRSAACPVADPTI
jgi:hypothetical protein